MIANIIRGVADKNKIRLLIADDSMFMRMAICAMCEMRPDIEVVGEAENGEEAVQMATDLRPDIVTMDLDMPGMDGIEATAVISSRLGIPIVVLSGLSERGSELTRRAFEAGARDCICKSASIMDVDLGTVAEEVVKKIVQWGRLGGVASS